MALEIWKGPIKGTKKFFKMIIFKNIGSIKYQIDQLFNKAETMIFSFN
jgi:hypothetical protein